MEILSSVFSVYKAALDKAIAEVDFKRLTKVIPLCVWLTSDVINVCLDLQFLYLCVL